MSSSGWSNAAGAVGLAGGIFSNNASQRAQNQYADQIMKLAKKQMQFYNNLSAPYRQNIGSSIADQSQLQNIAMGKVGQQDPYLKAGLQQNLQDLNRNRDYTNSLANLNFNSVGNKGAGIGMQIRANEAYVQGKNQANIGYGMAQNAYKQQNFNQANALTNQQVQLGQYGTSIASQAGQGFNTMAEAYGIKNQGLQDNYGGLAGMFGQVAGYGLDKWMNPQQKKKSLMQSWF